LVALAALDGKYVVRDAWEETFVLVAALLFPVLKAAVLRVVFLVIMPRPPPAGGLWRIDDGPSRR
jgi:hypothetical protein